MYVHQKPQSGAVSAAPRPAGSGSPTGRMPHERSRVPHHTSGVTSYVVPSTRNSPAQLPVWANRQASRMALLPVRHRCGCSCTAGNAPVQVRSNPMPRSSASHTTRSVCSGSITSMRYDPTCCFIRSSVSASENCTACWVSPMRTQA